MSKRKKIYKVYPRPQRPGMVGDGFRVYNYFPSGYSIREKISPFLMLDFNAAYDFGPSNHPLGVDVHPHKGFETVTIAYKGSVAHNDSKGNSGVIHPGDVQWMTAGSGILHKEFHEEEFSKQGGLFEMIQLWVNLPAKDKLTAPKYQSLTSDKITKADLPDNQGFVKVIAGNFENHRGAASTFTEMNVWDMRLNKNSKVTFSVPSNHNAAILVVEGSGKINSENVREHDFILFADDGTEVEFEADQNTVLLMLSGVPIHEPIAQYGPFVMNTNEELQEAFEEFRQGKFGILV